MSGLDFCCGAIAGLAAITPGSGFVAPWSSVIVGFTNGILCNLGCRLKHLLGIDDALDTFGVHGIGGFYGNIVAGIFAQKWIAELDGMKIEGGWVDGNWMQVPYQLAGSFAGAGWSFFLTYGLVFVMQKIPFLRLRLSIEEELTGDMAEMGEGAPVHYPAPPNVDTPRKESVPSAVPSSDLDTKKFSTTSITSMGENLIEEQNQYNVKKEFKKAVKGFFVSDKNTVQVAERIPNIP